MSKIFIFIIRSESFSTIIIHVFEIWILVGSLIMDKKINKQNYNVEVLSKKKLSNQLFLLRENAFNYSSINPLLFDL